MRTREPRPSPLILRDLLGTSVLTVSGSNQGEPYRETLLLDFGNDQSFTPADPIVSVELEPAEETALRALLNARFRRGLRNAAEHRGEGRTYSVTDFDRIRGGGMHSDAGAALREAESLSGRYPGNAIHVLGTVAIAVSGELRNLGGVEPSTAAKDALWVLLEAHRARLFEPAETNGNACGYRFGDAGETVLYLQNVEARRLLQDQTAPQESDDARDAARYRALRGIGAAPGGTKHLDEGLVLVSTNLDAWVDAKLSGSPIAPAHAAEGIATGADRDRIRNTYHAGAEAMRRAVLGLLAERRVYFEQTGSSRSGAMNRNWNRLATAQSYGATADEVRQIPPIVMPAEAPAEPPTPPEAQPPGRAVLAADVPELAAQLRTLVAYARGQIAEGKDHHPTLLSAVKEAEAALWARGLDTSSQITALIGRLKATDGDAKPR